MDVNSPQTTVQELLTSGLDDWVHLYEVHAQVARDNPDATTAQVQQKTLDTIRSLVAQGLFDVGDLGGPGGDFAAWSTPLDESIRRIADAYIGHFDDESAWIWKFWLALTDRGRRTAEAIQAEPAPDRSSAPSRSGRARSTGDPQEAPSGATCAVA